MSAFCVAAEKDFKDKVHPALRKAKGAELVPVIIQYSEGTTPDKNGLKAFGCRSRHLLKSVNSISAECPADSLGEIARIAEIDYLWEDEILAVSLDETVPLINATAAWADFGNGSGINVSIIDTGINKSHPALAGQVILEYDFAGEGTTDDLCDHGTPVACVVGCIDETYRGVAPGAKLFNAKVGKVINNEPRRCGATASSIIAAMEWSIEHGAQVIQMSVGGAVSSCYQSITANAVNASGKNVTIVVAAGNGGPSGQSIWTPGCAENALTVGASDGDSIADFSSRGPTDYGLEKPDVVAPGVDIAAASNDGVSFGYGYDGTSMASPYVAGVAALMLQQKTLLPFDVKQIINLTSVDLGYDRNTQGAGRIDAWAAVNLSRDWVGSPFLKTNVIAPSQSIVGRLFVVNVTISNIGSGDANGVNATLQVPPELSIIGNALQSAGTIGSGSSETLSWMLNSSAVGNFSANVSVVAEDVPETVSQFALEIIGRNFSIAIQPDAAEGKDAYISSSSPNTNYGTADPLKVQTNSLRTLIGWNLSSIPQDAVISSAIMRLYVPSVQKTNNNNVNVYRLTRQWYENNVTWNKYDGSHSWTTAGGDYNGTVWASTPVGASRKYYYWDVTGLVGSWHNSTYPNYGLILVSQSANNRKDFSSSDCSNASRRPALLVNYTF